MRRTFKQLCCLLALTLIAAPAVQAGGEGWTDNYAGAKTTAAEEGKDLILDFTGSDWCGWCIRLNKEVFSRDEFKTYAADNFVLVELDFPRDKSKVSDEVRKQNNELKDQFGVRGYPTIYLTDAKGRPYARTGYQAGGPANYIKHLQTLKEARVERDRHFDAANSAKGLAKAKHLHEGLEKLPSEMALKFYGEKIEQIIELDANNEAGLKKHYEDLFAAEKLTEQLNEVKKTARNEPVGAVAKIDKMLEQADLPAQTRQQMLVAKSEIQMFIIKDKAAAKTTLTQAIEAAPDTPIAENLRGALKRFFPDESE